MPEISNWQPSLSGLTMVFKKVLLLLIIEKKLSNNEKNV